MNIQNPAPYPPQQAYTGYGNVMAQPGMQPSAYPNDFAQNQFQQPFPQTPQRSNQFLQQPGAQVPQHVFQQLQHQQQGFMRPPSQGNNGMIPGHPQQQGQQRQSPSNPPGANPNQTPTPIPRTNAPQTPSSNPHQIPNTMAMATSMQQAMSNSSLAQAQIQMRMQNATQQTNRSTPSQQAPAGTQISTQQANNPPSPQMASREKARVTVLLEINSCLLQEVISLQSQGKAGPVTQQPPSQSQQSPTSPNSASADSGHVFSPTDSTPTNKATGPPSKEYQECMRRLQANLSYLAAIADAKKRPDGKVPPYPAILSPPTHLKDVQELYKKLTMLFPEAGQNKQNQAGTFVSGQQPQGGQGGQPPAPRGVGMGGSVVNVGLGTRMGNDPQLQQMKQAQGQG